MEAAGELQEQTELRGVDFEDSPNGSRDEEQKDKMPGDDAYFTVVKLEAQSVSPNKIIANHQVLEQRELPVVEDAEDLSDFANKMQGIAQANSKQNQVQPRETTTSHIKQKSRVRHTRQVSMGDILPSKNYNSNYSLGNTLQKQMLDTQ